MADVEPGRAEVHRAAGVGGDDDQRAGASPAAAPERGDLAVADLAGELGLAHRVRAAGAAAQAVVGGLAQPVRRREHGAHRALRLLHVAQVARVLHDDRRARCRAAAAAGCAATHSEKSRTRAANAWAAGVPSRRP